MYSRCIFRARFNASITAIVEYAEGRQTPRDQLQVDIFDSEQMETETKISGNESTYAKKGHQNTFASYGHKYKNAIAGLEKITYSGH